MGSISAISTSSLKAQVQSLEGCKLVIDVGTLERDLLVHITAERLSLETYLTMTREDVVGYLIRI